MAISDRLRQITNIGLTMATMAAGGLDVSKDQVSLPAQEPQVQRALPQDYSDLLSGENSEKLQPYVDLVRETKTGRELLNSMRQNGVRLTYTEPFVTDAGTIYMGGYMPKDNSIRLGAQGNPPDILWSVFHEATHSRTHNKLKKMGYARMPTSTLDDAYIANAIDEALAERTAAQGFLEAIEKHPEIKDQKTDYYKKIAQKYKEDHPELAAYKVRENLGNPGLETVKKWLKQGYKSAEIVQGLYEERLIGYEDSLADYESQALAFYNSGENNGYKMKVNPDWDQYVTKLSDGQVTKVPYFPEGSVWGLHDRISSEFSRLGNDMTKIQQMDLSCPINQEYRDAFVREGIKVYAGMAFASLYNEVPSVQKDILKLTGCNPCETYKNSAGIDVAYYDTESFKKASGAYSPQEYMEQACKIYTRPDVQKFLNTTYPATKSEILTIMTMKEVLFTPDGKVPDHIRPIKQVYDGPTESNQEAKNNKIFQQEALKRLKDVHS